MPPQDTYTLHEIASLTGVSVEVVATVEEAHRAATGPGYRTVPRETYEAICAVLGWRVNAV